MRKRLWWLALAFSAIASMAMAEVVSQEEAAYAARRWAMSGAVLGGPLGQTVRETVALSATNDIVLYAVRFDGGTAFVSSDTGLEPIVAYASSTNFMPEADNKLWTLLRRDTIVRHAALRFARTPSLMATASAGFAAQAQASADASGGKWAALLEGRSAQQNLRSFAATIPNKLNGVTDVRCAPLLKSQWSQTTAQGQYCYNIYTPSHAPCGCTATAMSQIMRYHEFPKDSVAAKTYTCKVGPDKDHMESVSLTMQGGTYEWSKMTLCPASSAYVAENWQAIGKLTSDAGIALQTRYQTPSAVSWGSGSSFVSLVGKTLKEAFGYANAAAIWNWDIAEEAAYGDGRVHSNVGLHNLAVREKVIYANLDAKCPVEFGVYGYGDGQVGNVDYWEGHAIVGDGYGYSEYGGEKVPYVHINLGWGGVDDAWYNIPEIHSPSSGSYVGSAGTVFTVLSAAVYNIFPTKTGNIVSGRICDDYGQAIAGARMTIRESGSSEIIEEGDSDAKGIYAFIVSGSKSYDITCLVPSRNLRETHTVTVPKDTLEVVDNQYGVYTEIDANVGNYWGQDADFTMGEPCVSNMTSGVVYRKLDVALAEAADSETLALLASAVLPASQTLTHSIAICSANAAVFEVTANGMLTLDEAARVLFTNVVFTGASPVLTVGDGCTAAIGGAVGLDRIVLEGSGQVELAGELSGTYAYRIAPSEGHGGLGETFGRATVDLTTARKYANLFINEFNGELVGEAVDDGSGGVALRWVVGDVPEAAAVARLNQDGVSTRFADLKVLVKYVTNDAEIVILKDCPFDSVLRTGEHALTIRSDDGLVVTPKDGTGTAATTNAFVIAAGGSLTVSNVVFSGFSQFGDVGAFVRVEEGGAFRMLSGAEIRDIYNAGSCGAVYVAGEMSMTNGARIVGCTAEYGYEDVGGYGAGVYLKKGGKLDFHGAEISGCRAEDHGGGVYVEIGATLNLSGAAHITGNEQGSTGGQKVADDIYVCRTESIPINVADVLPEARVGIRPSSDGDREEALGTAFANLSGVLSEETAADVFFNDRFTGYYDGLVGGVSGDKLVWVAKEVKPGSVPESEGTIVVDVGGETNYYKKLSYAFGSVAEGESAVITLLTNVLMDADIAVAGTVTLDGAGWLVYQGVPEQRYENRFFTVSGAETSLCLTNVSVIGLNEAKEGYCAYGTLFKVEQNGRLTLENKACVGYVAESDSEYWPDARSTPAINLESGAWLTMRSGSVVLECRNDPDEENGIVGAGIVASGQGTVFRMEGGTVSGCTASRGSGVIIENDAVLEVSGDARIVGNEDFDGTSDDLYASGRSVVLANVFTGAIGYTLGATTASSETNVFGTVASSVSLEQLAPSAANFHKDADHEVTGRIVTNATEALLVWSSAVTPEGIFTDRDGNRYVQVGSDPPGPTPPGPEPPVDPETTNWPSAIAFRSISRLSATQWTLVVTDRVECCRYRLLSTDDLTKGFVSTGDWEQAVSSGPWTTNVTTSAGQSFWKAEGTWGIVPKGE